jgi:pimeloyl-ACP methyl ester carboxylesterase
LRVGDGGATQRIAYLADPPTKEPPVSLFWLSGYRSDMASTKATALAEFARQKGYGCTRFDYSGHGVSSGRFEDGTIGQWLAEAEAVFRRATRGRQIVIGCCADSCARLPRRLPASPGSCSSRPRGT